MTQHRFTSKRRALLCALLLVLSTSTLAQILTPPIVHWIGPEPACDFPTIQDALGEIFDCPVGVLCPGRHELRLAASYEHSGQVVVERTFDIVGGYAACEGAASGLRHSLTATPGESLLVIAPGSRTIDNVLRNLQLSGVANGALQGGVIHMQTGAAALTLRDSLVSGGGALDGGGIYLAGAGNRLDIIDSTIADNQATRGGGIFCTHLGVVDFQSGAIQDNTAVRAGGGIYLEGGCRLLGRTPGMDRRVARNLVEDHQLGEGGGIYAFDAEIEMGAPLSRTMIDDNTVQWLPLHDYEEPGENQGGGVHLEAATATFHNTWFRGNAAADGGAISVSGNSDLLVDRYSGPCHQDVSDSPELCSRFEFNRARGGTDRGGDEGGDGAVLVTQVSAGASPLTEIYRTTIRSNIASCFEDDDDQAGECDINFFGPPHTKQSIIYEVSRLGGNLIYDNHLGDLVNCTTFNCSKLGYLIEFVSEFYENTLTENLSSDAVFRDAPKRLLNNIVWDSNANEDVEESTRVLQLSSCNLTNFGDEFDQLAAEVNVPALNQDPDFIFPIVGPDADFRLQVPDSPGLDRCDDEQGELKLRYDIVGTPRGLNIGGINNGSGARDAGAFEAVPAGFVNQTTDLLVIVESELPKQAELGEPHRFTIDVRNVGHNAVAGLTVTVFPSGAELTSLSGAAGFNPGSPTPVPIWDCGRLICRYLPAALAAGSVTSTITARLVGAREGTASLDVEVFMEDSNLEDIEPGNNVAFDSFVVGPGADMAVELFAPPTGTVNQSAEFGLYPRNLGPNAADEVIVQLALSGGQVVGFDAPGWTCSAPSARCTHQGPMRASDPLRAITVQVNFPESGSQTITASIDSDQGDPNTANNAVEHTVEILTPVDQLFGDGFESSSP